MKLPWFSMIVFLFPLFVEGQGHLSMPRRGLSAKVSVEVRDDMGNAVPNAIVTASFVLLGERGMQKVRATTDEVGLTELSGKAIREVIIDVESPGHYRSRKEHYFLSKDTNHLAKCIAAGRWEPWNERIAVTLRRKIKPITGVLPHNVWKSKLNVGERYGFDAEKGVFVTQEDNDKDVSFFVLADKYINTPNPTETPDQANVKLSFLFEDEESGIQECDFIKTESCYGLPYRFSESGYSREYSVWAYWNFTGDRRESKWPDFQEHYFQFTFLDKNGKRRYGLLFLFGCNIGKEGATIDLHYYLNETEDATNSEFPLFF